MEITSKFVESLTARSLRLSEEAMVRARQSIGSGLSSSFRRRDNQVVFERSEGAYLWDIEGQRYIDCVCAHGPVFVGHAHPEVLAAATASLQNGIQFGGPHQRETELAERILEVLPWAEKFAFMNTGSEANQLAVRIARATTGRQMILKFDGHYHGWIDPLFLNSPGIDSQAPGALSPEDDTFAPVSVPKISNTAGQLPSSDVVVGNWNDIDQFRDLMALAGDSIAAVLLEPLATNFGTFTPSPGYLEELISIAHRHGALVIFDEVVSGFRIALGGASELLGVTPDLAIYAKAMGSGFPIAGVAGTNAAMRVLDDGRVMTAGTYSGTPASVSASLATLSVLVREGNQIYSRLDELGARLAAGLATSGRRAGLPVQVNQVGSLAQMFIGDIADTTSIAAIQASDKALVTEICEAMIPLGIYTSRKGLFYLNAAHTADDIDTILEVFEAACSQVLSARRSR